MSAPPFEACWGHPRDRRRDRTRAVQLGRGQGLPLGLDDEELHDCGGARVLGTCHRFRTPLLRTGAVTHTRRRPGGRDPADVGRPDQGRARCRTARSPTPASITRTRTRSPVCGAAPQSPLAGLDALRVSGVRRGLWRVRCGCSGRSSATTGWTTSRRRSRSSPRRRPSSSTRRRWWRSASRCDTRGARPLRVTLSGARSSSPTCVGRRLSPSRRDPSRTRRAAAHAPPR
jgi:hypothetical protein